MRTIYRDVLRGKDRVSLRNCEGVEERCAPFPVFF